MAKKNIQWQGRSMLGVNVILHASCMWWIPWCTTTLLWFYLWFRVHLNSICTGEEIFLCGRYLHLSPLETCKAKNMSLWLYYSDVTGPWLSIHLTFYLHEWIMNIQWVTYNAIAWGWPSMGENLDHAGEWHGGVCPCWCYSPDNQHSTQRMQPASNSAMTFIHGPSSLPRASWWTKTSPANIRWGPKHSWRMFSTVSTHSADTSEQQMNPTTCHRVIHFTVEQLYTCNVGMFDLQHRIAV